MCLRSGLYAVGIVFGVKVEVRGDSSNSRESRQLGRWSVVVRIEVWRDNIMLKVMMEVRFMIFGND